MQYTYLPVAGVSVFGCGGGVPLFFGSALSPRALAGRVTATAVRDAAFFAAGRGVVAAGVFVRVVFFAIVEGFNPD
jgi:hypothetical protein